MNEEDYSNDLSQPSFTVPSKTMNDMEMCFSSKDVVDVSPPPPSVRSESGAPPNTSIPRSTSVDL